MSARVRTAPRISRPLLVGAALIAVLSAIVYVSYTAQNGLPWQATYRVWVDVPNAAEMTKNSDVRIGGARVGQVLSIDSQPARAGHPALARLEVVMLRGSVATLPADTRVQIRLASLLGGKYLELTPGVARRMVPDGGHLPLSNAVAIVDIDQALSTLDPTTAEGLRGTIRPLGDSLAGRGVAVNESLGAMSRLLGPLTRVLRTLADPRTELARLIKGAAAASGALAPLAARLGSMIDHATVTLGALDAASAALGQTVEALPGTELTATRTLVGLRPVLRDAAALARGLRPAARLLPRAARGLGSIIRSTTPVLRRVPGLARPLNETFTSTLRFARDPASRGSIASLRGQDFATFAASMFLGLGGAIRDGADAQLHCNAIALWARNVGSALSDGDPAGTWLTFVPVVNPSQADQVSAPSADLHFNPYPREGAHSCEAGNERYSPGQAIGHPSATNGSAVELTAPPPGVRARYSSPRGAGR